jgi:hypothetical protein
VRRLVLAACVGCSNPTAVTPDASADAHVPVLSLTPGGFDFGEHEVGDDRFPTVDVAVKNISPSPIDLTSIAVAGADAADFTLDNECGASLAADESCGLTVRFHPLGANLRSAHLDVTAGTETVSAPLRGTGFVRSLRLVFDPPLTNFGDIPAGTTSPNVTIAVLNEAVAAGAAFTPSITGDNAASFQLVSHTCGMTIPLHGTCEVVMTMTPPWSGAHIASLRLAADSVGAWSGSLTGTSTAPLYMAPVSASFGSMLIGQPETTTQVAFNILNSATTTTGPLTPSLSGAGADGFAIDSTDCTTLAPNASCSVFVRLAATTRGNKVAHLVVTDGGSALEARSTLVGSAYTVFISTTPQFVDTSVGQTTTKTFKILNPSERDTGAVSVSIVGTQFTVVDTSTCASGIAAHQSCTVQVTFAPTSTGTQTATLQASASPGSSHSVTLTGIGQ